MTSLVDTFLEAHLAEFQPADPRLLSAPLGVPETFIRKHLSRLQELFGKRLWHCLALSPLSTEFFEAHAREFLVPSMQSYFVVNPDIPMSFLQRHFPSVAQSALRFQRSVKLEDVVLDKVTLTLLLANEHCGEQLLLQLRDHPTFLHYLDDDLIETMVRNQGISNACLERELPELKQKSRTRRGMYSKPISVRPRTITMFPMSIPKGYLQFYQVLFPEVECVDCTYPGITQTAVEFPLSYLEANFAAFNEKNKADYWLGVPAFARIRAFEQRIHVETAFATRKVKRGLLAQCFSLLEQSNENFLQSLIYARPSGN